MEMYRMLKLRVNLQIFGVIILCWFCIGGVHGFRCYDCIETDDPQRDLQDANACVNVLPADRTKSCLLTSSAPYCLKIAGIQDGRHVVIRTCGADSWRRNLRSTDTCTQAQEVNRRGSTQVKIDHGWVCICDSDKCNSASPLYNFSSFTFGCIAVIIGIFHTLLSA